MYNAIKIIETIKELKLLHNIDKIIKLSDIFAISLSGSINSLEYICNSDFKVIDDSDHNDKTNEIFSSTFGNGNYTTLHWIFIRNPQWIYKIDFYNIIVSMYLLRQHKTVNWIKQHQRKIYSKKFLYILRKVFNKIDDNVPNCILDYVWLGFEFKSKGMTRLQRQLLE
jgi:hypothetical protein